MFKALCCTYPEGAIAATSFFEDCNSTVRQSVIHLPQLDDLYCKHLGMSENENANSVTGISFLPQRS